MSELQKLESFRYSLAVAETFNEIKLIKDAATSFAELARLQNLSLEKQNEVGLFRNEITAKVGRWLDENYPSNHASNQYLLGNNDEPSKMPVSKRESSDSRLIANNPDEVREAEVEIKESGDVITPSKVAKIVREKLRDERTDQEQPEESHPKYYDIHYNIQCVGISTLVHKIFKQSNDDPKIIDEILKEIRRLKRR